MPDLLLGLDRQLNHVERHLSRYFSPNTHLLGEALALYVCGRALPELASSARRASLGRAILLNEATRQVLPDGGHVERSPHYHRYALEFFLLALTVARLTDDGELASTLEPVANRMATFFRHVCDASGRFALVGDDDGGELCPIAGRQHGHARMSLGWAASVLQRPELRSPPVPEAVAWLTGHDVGMPRTHNAPSLTVIVRVPDGTAPARTFDRSVVLAETGYVAARRGASHLLFDVGSHGFLGGGHAHADALAVTIVARGIPLLIDPGTYTYTMDRVQRDRLRSSQWHNTVSLGMRSQSEPGGPFRWKSAASGRLRHAALNPSFDYAEGDTDAWTPGVHERIVFFAGDDTWIIADHLVGTGTERAALHWHIDSAWQAHVDPRGGVQLRHDSGAQASLTLADAIPEVFRGDPLSGLGWMSPAYGRLEPATTVRAVVEQPSPFWLVTAISIGAYHDHAPLRRLEVLSSTSGPAAMSVSCQKDGLNEVTLFRAPGPREMVTVLIDPRKGYAVTTDARLVHARIGEGRLARLCLVDGTVMRFDGADPVTISAATPIADLAAVFVPGAAPIVESSSPRRDIAIEIESLQPRSRGSLASDARNRGTARSRASCVELPGSRIR
jgi:hypothetical protein